MGFRIDNQCRAELIDVAREMCAGLTGVSSAGVVRCVGVQGAAGGYVLQVETTAPAGAVTSSTLAVPQLPCDENEAFRDQVELFGLGLAAIVGVWLAKHFVLKLVMPQ